MLKIMKFPEDPWKYQKDIKRKSEGFPKCWKSMKLKTLHDNVKGCQKDMKEIP